MKINRLYFSPTGSTKKVVNIISDIWDGEKLDIDFSIANKDYTTYSFGKDELCFIGVPSFGGRVPTVALDHLKQMRGNDTATVLITTYGNRHYDDTLLELKETISKNGFHVIAAIAAVTEHSIMKQFGTGRPDEDDIKTLYTYAERIKESFEKDSILPVVKVKGNTPYREYNGLPLKPKADETCTKCGICAKKCPTNAIPYEDPSETNDDICITCMGCVVICPEQSRKLNPEILFAAGKKMEEGCSSRKENELFL